MAKLTGTKHGIPASNLMGFYIGKANQLEESRQYFMAAVALALAVETAILSYLLVEFDDDKGGGLKIPSNVNFADLIEAANAVDVLNAPIDGPRLVGKDKRPPKHVAKDVADKIRLFRNLIHPARALRDGFDPRNFRAARLREFREMCESVMHSLMYNL